MPDVDTRLMVFSSKRSTHHAFLEGLLAGHRYVYDNNVRVIKDRELDVNRTTTSDEPADAPMIHVASFERGYRLPRVYSTEPYQELESRWTGSAAPQRVIYLRDPLNTLASTYQVYKMSPYFSDRSYITRNLRQWSNVARYVLDGADGETFIYANRFWDDESYQEARLERLGVAIYQRSDRLSRFGGGGNTFFADDKRTITPASLASRHTLLADDSEFVDLVQENKELFLRFSEYVEDEMISAALRTY